jgi:HAE1 family hydrophobic/amphiphilic exporter-1
MVVDDAIVVLENVTTHIERGADPKQAAVHGTNEVAISVIASTLTLIAVFFPLTMVTGMTGVLFRQLGWMVTIMMIISTTSALSLTPMLCSQWLRLRSKEEAAKKNWWTPIKKALDRFDNFYAGLLHKVVGHRGITIIICMGIFVLSLFLLKFVGSEFMPTQDNARIGANLELPIGTRVEESKEVMARLDSLWRAKYPEIVTCSYTVGPASSDNTYASLSDNGSHIVSMNIRLKDATKRKRGIVEIAADMRRDIDEQFPEFKKVQVNVGGGRSNSMSGQQTVDFEIYGYDFDETDKVAQELKAALKDIKGTADITISRSDYQPEYQVDFDREKLSMYGINLQTAAYYLRNRINGSTATEYREDGEEYDVKVMYAPENRTEISDIENIMIYSSTGQGIRLKELGTVVERFTPPTIERKDRERIITVSTVVDGVPMSQVVEQAQAKIDKMEIPTGISVELSGSYEDQQDSFSDLMMLGILIIILVYIVMAAQFESFTYPGIIMTSLLFAFSGVFIILWLTGHTLNIMSMIGAIMLIGIVVKNGIVLIDYITLNRERGMSIRRAVIDGGRSRLRPVVMTTLTTILGMVPMAVGRGEGAELWRPMGTAVIGGLTFSTILTLLFVPTLYCVFAGNGVKRQRRKIKKAHELKEVKE